MSADKRALLAAIGTSPDDDLLRLVFADWCDENDEPERARFIRLQIEAEQCGEDSPERESLEEQAAAVFSAHHSQWLADEPVWARSAQLRFGISPVVSLYGIRKGFLERLNLNLNDCLANASEIFATAPIRELWLENIPDGGRMLSGMTLPGHVVNLTLGFSITPPHWQSVLSSPLLRGLRELKLCLFGDQHLAQTGDGGITCDERDVLDDNGAIAIAACASLSTLTSLALGTGTISARGIKAIVRSPYLAGLEKLSLAGHPVGDDGLVHLARSPLAAKLTELDLRNTQVGDAGLREFLAAEPSRLRRLSLGSYGQHPVTADGLDALFRSKSLTGLTDLLLDCMPLTTDHIRSLAHNPSFASLRILHIGNSGFDDRMAEELAASPHLRCLRTLDLQNNRVGACGMSALALSPVLDTVTNIELYNVGAIGDEGATALACSEHVRELRRLSLVATGLGLEGLRAVANSPHLAQLRSLNVENRPFGDDGARALYFSPYLRHIKELRVNDCGIGKQLAGMLRERFGSAVKV